MKPTFTVFLDLDGVLVDFINGMCHAHGREHPYNNEENFGAYSIEECWGIETSELWKVANEPEFWSSLDWLPDGRELYKNVIEAAGAENVTILTSGNHPSAAAGKVQWIHKHLPEVREQYLIGPQKSVCARSDAVLLDDNDQNVYNFRKAGGHALLVPREWNSKHQSASQDIPWRMRKKLTFVMYDIQTYHIDSAIRNHPIRRGFS